MRSSSSSIHSDAVREGVCVCVCVCVSVYVRESVYVCMGGYEEEKSRVIGQIRGKSNKDVGRGWTGGQASKQASKQAASQPANQPHRQTVRQSDRHALYFDLQNDSLTRKARPRRMSPRMLGVPASSLSSWLVR